MTSRSNCSPRTESTFATTSGHRSPINDDTRIPLDAAVAGVAERIDAEGDQPGCDDPKKERPVRGVGDLRERTVEPDRLVRVVVERRLDQKDTDQTEDDHPREVAEAADPLDPVANPRAHLLGLRVLEEVLADAAVALVEPDP